MTRPPRDYLVCYDIRDPARLTAVRRTVRAWGDRLQYSIYRCTLSDRQLAVLTDKLVQEINHAEDQIAFVDLGSVDADAPRTVRTLGLPPVQTERVVKIV